MREGVGVAGRTQGDAPTPSLTIRLRDGDYLEVHGNHQIGDESPNAINVIPMV